MSDVLETVIGYHEATKHHFNRMARSLGYLDWATQPDPFRSYTGADLLKLDVLEPTEMGPRYDEAFYVGQVAPAALDRVSVSQLFYDSLAISTWVNYGNGTLHSKRVNPSSGNLHPTEAYLICGAVDGLTETPLVAHYAPKVHALEKRAHLTKELWEALTARLPQGAVLVGLSSIAWRESWKYGERAYRYCHLDIGHAIAALTVAASGLGWQVQLVDHLGHEQLNLLLGLFDSAGPEKEQPDCLLALYPVGQGGGVGNCQINTEVVDAFRDLDWQGTPNVLSPSHMEWSLIDVVAEATRKPETAGAFGQNAGRVLSVAEEENADLVEGRLATRDWTDSISFAKNGECESSANGLNRGVSLRQVVRQRRSAIEMDGVSTMSAEAFYRLMSRMMASAGQVPYAVLPWEPLVDLAVFVHRVEGVEPGLYVLARHALRMEMLQSAVRSEFLWQQPASCPEGLPLYLLQAGDFKEIAKQVSCIQDIAADGCFSLGMITEFQRPLAEQGAWFYPRLYWECGMIGQMLYLEAEVNGLRGTGIGCFMDDPMHRILGLKDRHFQSLYHFTVGGAKQDSRVAKEHPAYRE